MGKFKAPVPSFNLKDDAVPFSKYKQKSVKGAFGMTKPEVDTSSQDAILEQQRLDSAKINDEENKRRKRLLSAAQGVRSYRGSVFSRASPSNTAGASSGSSSAAVSAQVRNAGFASRGVGNYA